MNCTCSPTSNLIACPNCGGSGPDAVAGWHFRRRPGETDAELGDRMLRQPGYRGLKPLLDAIAERINNHYGDRLMGQFEFSGESDECQRRKAWSGEPNAEVSDKLMNDIDECLKRNPDGGMDLFKLASMWRRKSENYVPPRFNIYGTTLNLIYPGGIASALRVWEFLHEPLDRLDLDIIMEDNQVPDDERERVIAAFTGETR